MKRSGERFRLVLSGLGVRTRCHDGRVSWSLRDEALGIVLVGDLRAVEAAVRARRNMGGYLLGLVCIFGLVGGGILAGGSWEYGW